MKKVIGIVSMVGLLALGLGLSGVVRAAGTAAPAMSHGGFQHDWIGVVSYAEKQVMDLEEAVPQNKYNWRPGTGVRSVAETYLHIAWANYGLLKAATGKDPAADAGWDMNAAKWEKKTTDKAEIKKILDKSFAHVKEIVGALPDADLDKKVSFFGHEMTARAVLIILSSHIDEHLGQSIAYARMNKIVPPWSKNEKTAMADEKK